MLFPGWYWVRTLLTATSFLVSPREQWEMIDSVLLTEPAAPGALGELVSRCGSLWPLPGPGLTVLLPCEVRCQGASA